MFKSKCSTKKNSMGRIVHGGVIMKPDLIATFMDMDINQEVTLSRKIATIGKVRTYASRLSVKTGRKYVVTSEDMDEKFTVRREA